jgi:hypothetical protein
MGKYEPLAAHLQGVRSDSWIAGFAELEEVLGFALPPSAHRYREWWANQRSGGHSQAKGWQDAGWKVWEVDLAEKRVEFRRGASRPKPINADHPEPSEEELMRRASLYLDITDRSQIVREALKALCAREAAQRLVRLGGTMPDLEAPPRRRFA